MFKLRYTFPVALFFLSSMILSCSDKSQDANYPVIPVKYPETSKVDHQDNYFGQSVSDPYRWLEFDTAQEVMDWVQKENEVTFGYLDKIPFRTSIRKRLDELWNYPKIGAPFRAGEYFMFFKNEGLQNQSVLYIQKGLDGNPEVLIDPNALSKEGTTALTGLSISHDKKYLAYSTAQAGSDWNTIEVLEIATRKKLEDNIQWVKFSNAAWKGNGFYYSRYDEPGKGGELSQKNSNHKVYFHILGEDQKNDKLIYEDKTHPLRYYGAQVTEDERFLILNVSEGTSGDEIRYMDLSAGDKSFKTLLPGFKNNHQVVDNIGGNLLVKTDSAAPMYRLVSIDPKHPEVENWNDILPAEKHLLKFVGTAGGSLFATYLQDATDRVFRYSQEGVKLQEIELPGMGSVDGFDGDKDDQDLFFSFTSFIVPSTIYRYHLADQKVSLYKQPELKFDPSAYETQQVFFTSTDGKKVPMFLIHKKGLEKNGNNPVYLYGYGGFNISLTPTFSPSRLVFLEQGGVVAIANLRGGGEYGEEWHKAGMLNQKQQVFDDFIAAAEYLIQEKYTKSTKLAIAGGSNGGLLVGACMTQRPDLFAVALPAVGVLDMLRFHKFTVGWGWVVEYGSSDDSLQFQTLYKYSPLHNLKPGTKYPSTLITTADHDDRVVPAHSFKFAAALQAAHKGDNPVLIRVDVKAGHGAGKPTSKILDEQADIWSFVLYNTQTPVKLP